MKALDIFRMAREEGACHSGLRWFELFVLTNGRLLHEAPASEFWEWMAKLQHLPPVAQRDFSQDHFKLLYRLHASWALDHMLDWGTMKLMERLELKQAFLGKDVEMFTLRGARRAWAGLARAYKEGR